MADNFWDTNGGRQTEQVLGINPITAPAYWGYKGIKALAGMKPKLNPRKAMVDAMAKDLAALQNNPQALGLTGAEKRQMVDATAQQAGAQRQSAISQIGREALAGQGFQQAAFTGAAQGIAGDAAADVAAATAAAEQMSNEKIEAARARIMGEIDAERQKRSANRQMYMQFGLDAAETIGALAGLGG